MTEINASKFKKLIEENLIKFLVLYDVYRQNNDRDRMTKLIAPTSLAYSAFVCKRRSYKLLVIPEEEFTEITNKKFAVDNTTGHAQILQSLAMKQFAMQGFSRHDVESISTIS